MHFSKKICAQFGLAIGLAASTYTAQAGVISYTMSGTIAAGFDQLNHFHSGQILDGQRFTQTISTELNTMVNWTDSLGRHYLVSPTDGQDFSGMTSVNGHQYAWKVRAKNVLVYIQQGVATRLPNQHDVMGISIWGNSLTPDGKVLSAMQEVASTIVPFINNTDMYQTHTADLTIPGMLSNSYFSLEHAGQSSFFWGNPDSVTWAPVAVPEPETYALMLMGLAGLGLIVKRKKQG